MPKYRVDFKDNIAIAATEITGSLPTVMREFETADGKTFIKWYIVEANNAEDAIQIASIVVKRI